MNGASDQPEEFGVQPEQGRQEEPQSNADSAADATATSDATASPEDSTSSVPHSRRVRRRMQRFSHYCAKIKQFCPHFLLKLFLFPPAAR